MAPVAFCLKIRGSWRGRKAAPYCEASVARQSPCNANRRAMIIRPEEGRRDKVTGVVKRHSQIVNSRAELTGAMLPNAVRSPPPPSPLSVQAAALAGHPRSPEGPRYLPRA